MARNGSLQWRVIAEVYIVHFPVTLSGGEGGAISECGSGPLDALYISVGCACVRAHVSSGEKGKGFLPVQIKTERGHKSSWEPRRMHILSLIKISPDILLRVDPSLSLRWI